MVTEPIAKEDKNVIWIFDNSNYEYPKFEERWKDHWFDNFCDYDENGVFKGNRYRIAKTILNDYMKTWSEAHKVDRKSKEYAAEKASVQDYFLSKYKESDISKAEVNKLWEDYIHSDQLLSDKCRVHELDWDSEISNLNSLHSIPSGTVFVVASDLGLWDGRRVSYGIWTPKQEDCASLGILCSSFCKTFMKDLDYISIFATVDDGAINFEGSHHDGQNSYKLFAINELMIKDPSGENCSVDEYIAANNMTAKCLIEKFSKPLATIPAHIYGHDTVKLDPYFAE